MPTVRTFEELQVWQMARAQCQEVFELMEDGRFDLDVPLRDQINRSSGSVMDNIAEDFDRFSRVDFRHFLVIARGSNAEVRSQLHRAADRRYLTEGEKVRMIEAANHLGIKINSLVRYLDQPVCETKTHGNQQPGLREPEELYAEASGNFFYELPPTQIQEL